MTRPITPETLSAILAWRRPYEADPSVTHYTIAAAVGVTQPTVSRHARIDGWAPDADVAQARRSAARRKAGGKPSSTRRPPKPAPAFQPAASPASIWQLAAGKSVSTVRQGGRHVEVSA